MTREKCVRLVRNVPLPLTNVYFVPCDVYMSSVVGLMSSSRPRPSSTRPSLS